VGRLTDSARQIRWYIGALMGDTHYQRYLDYRSRVHPGEPILSERDYWRLRHEGTESSPNPRCC
jgi:hypothetical protein